MSNVEIWTEKYRPAILSEVIGQVNIVEKLEAFVKQKNLPHLLFSGPAGVGKTTCAVAIANMLYGDNWHSNLLELNASDERGIDTIRIKVKDFARTKPIGKVPFKLILLDEADALTKDAQHALRRIMENYSATCRFILSCNYSSKIILPIQSRCVLFRFKPLTPEGIKEYVKNIADNEKLKISDKTVTALIAASEGDLRRVTNLMQSCASVSSELTEEIIYSVSGVAEPEEIKAIIESALKGQIKPAREKASNLMLRYGITGTEIIKLMNRVLWELSISDEKKIHVLDKFGEYEFRLVEGADEMLQIEALLAQLALIGVK